MSNHSALKIIIVRLLKVIHTEITGGENSYTAVGGFAVEDLDF